VDQAQMIERMKAGRAGKAARGGYAYGRPPFGSVASGGELAANDHELKVVPVILAARASGAPLRKIAKDLNQAGYRTKAGKNWGASAVSRVIERFGPQLEPDRADSDGQGSSHSAG
jgi:DNA invertase Pin-like site-specific DNA recombinase